MTGLLRLVFGGVRGSTRPEPPLPPGGRDPRHVGAVAQATEARAATVNPSTAQARRMSVAGWVRSKDPVTTSSSAGRAAVRGSAVAAHDLPADRPSDREHRRARRERERAERMAARNSRPATVGCRRSIA